MSSAASGSASTATSASASAAASGSGSAASADARPAPRKVPNRFSKRSNGGKGAASASDGRAGKKAAKPVRNGFADRRVRGSDSASEGGETKAAPSKSMYKPNKFIAEKERTLKVRYVSHRTLDSVGNIPARHGWSTGSVTSDTTTHQLVKVAVLDEDDEPVFLIEWFYAVRSISTDTGEGHSSTQRFICDYGSADILTPDNEFLLLVELGFADVVHIKHNDRTISGNVNKLPSTVSAKGCCAPQLFDWESDFNGKDQWHLEAFNELCSECVGYTILDKKNKTVMSADRIKHSWKDRYVLHIKSGVNMLHAVAFHVALGTMEDAQGSCQCC